MEASKRKHNDTENNDNHSKKRSNANKKDSKSAAQDIAKRLSVSSKSKNKSKNAQPPALSKTTKRKNKRSNATRTQKVPSVKSKDQGTSVPPPTSSSFSSLLPPPLPSLKSNTSSSASSLSSGLSSWEEFLGRADSSSRDASRDAENRFLSRNNQQSQESLNNIDKHVDSDETVQQLPSISDLFPPDIKKETSTKPSSSAPGEQQSLDGVLPVSELFYRSSQAMATDGRDDVENSSSEEQAASAGPNDFDGDDEELPFSAEQSDTLTTDENKVSIRRNRAALEQTTDKQQAASKRTSSANNRANWHKAKNGNRRNRGRKLVRRGMEMFLGGTPINADPPQRSIDLSYNFTRCENENSDFHADASAWASAITLDSPTFGRLLHNDSVESISLVELGLFCENFVSAAMKWDICPKDLRDVVKRFVSSRNSREVEDEAATTSSFVNGEGALETDERDNNILSLLQKVDEMDVESEESPMSVTDKKAKKQSAAKGFGKVPSRPRTGRKKTGKPVPLVSYSFAFALDIGMEELGSVDDSRDSAENVFGRIITRGLATHLKSKLESMKVRTDVVKLSEGDGGTTDVTVDFVVECKPNLSRAQYEKARELFDTASMAMLMINADFSVALAAAAKMETAWPEEIRDRVVEELLLQDDDVNMPWDGAESNALAEALSNPEPFSANGESGKSAQGHDDLFDHGGAFADCSESNSACAPYRGRLGPVLLSVVVERSLERPPRVIAIGDVHGCIDEMQELLRLCDYRPGDQVVFLGDLVSKGPDSISVVQMAREIGAIAVRGNHDFEVIRWYQAIKAGVDPPVVGSEHFHIASCLSQADMEWMNSQPWYMTSKDLGALFVHAGFVSGIRLSKQNPRLMMNMRSILPDGTVTSKFFNNWPWARLWDGPQTVLFGHDADRGLQQYEHAIGLDTGCVYGGRLTACILPEKRLVSVCARRQYFQYRRKHYD